MSLASPYLKKKDLNVLADVQRHYTKGISCMWEFSYTLRPSKVDLPTLLDRENTGDAILAYKLLRAIILPALFPTIGDNSRTRVHH